MRRQPSSAKSTGLLVLPDAARFAGLTAHRDPINRPVCTTLLKKKKRKRAGGGE